MKKFEIQLNKNKSYDENVKENLKKLDDYSYQYVFYLLDTYGTDVIIKNKEISRKPETITKEKWDECKHYQTAFKKQLPNILRITRGYERGTSYNLTDEQIIEKISNDIINKNWDGTQITASSIMKDASKAFDYEELFVKYVKEKYKYTLEKLPKAGGKSVNITKDGLFEGACEKGKNVSKSLDMKYTSHTGKIFYTTNKYTSINGGAQKNQAKDALATATSFSDYVNDGHIYLFVILDGDYYNNGGMQIIKEIKELNNPRIKICNAENINNIIEILERN